MANQHVMIEKRPLRNSIVNRSSQVTYHTSTKILTCRSLSKSLSIVVIYHYSFHVMIAKTAWRRFSSHQCLVLKLSKPLDLKTRRFQIRSVKSKDELHYFGRDRRYFVRAQQGVNCANFHVIEEYIRYFVLTSNRHLDYPVSPT